MEVIAPNVRGLGGKVKRTLVNELLLLERPDVMMLLESKTEFYCRKLIRSIWKCRVVEWVESGSFGSSGRILMMWDGIKVANSVDVVEGSSFLLE